MIFLAPSHLCSEQDTHTDAVSQKSCYTADRSASSEACRKKVARFDNHRAIGDSVVLDCGGCTLCSALHGGGRVEIQILPHGLPNQSTVPAPASMSDAFPHRQLAAWSSIVISLRVREVLGSNPRAALR